MRRRPVYQQAEWRDFAVLTVIAVGLMVSHHRARLVSQPSRPERAVRAALVPLQESLSAAWNELSNGVGGLARGRRLARENEELKRAKAELETKLIQLQYERLDYQDLRAAFGYEPAASPTEIRAWVVGRSGGRFVRQTIDIVTFGDREVRKGDIVLWAGRLVGRVGSAQGSRARVTLLLDPNSGVAAVAKPSNAKGAVLGPDPASSDPGLLRLVRLEREAHLAVGEKVYTSSIGETYPPGILIGVVEEVVVGSGPAEPKTALVRPYVDFGDLNYVTVMRPGG